MRRILPLFIFIAVFFYVSPVFAVDRASQYRDSYETYRKAYDSYVSAKSQYLAFKSLTAQTALLDSSKLFMTSRSDVIALHFTFLSEKLGENHGYTTTEQAKAFAYINQVPALLKQYNQNVSTATSLDHLLPLNESFRQTHATYQLRSRVSILHYRTSLDSQLASASARINENLKKKIAKYKEEGKQTSRLETWTQEVDRRIITVNNTINSVKGIIFAPEVYSNNIDDAETFVNSSDETLKQINQFFSEIITGMKEVHGQRP